MPRGQSSVSVFSTTTGNRSAERLRLVRFTFPKELWVADLRNTQKTASQLHSYNDSMNTWKKKIISSLEQD